MIKLNHGKYRMVSFRLSVDEYTRAHAACLAYGYRSMSLCARSALLAFSPSNALDPYEPQINEMQHRIEFLTLELSRVLKHIQLTPQASGLLEPAETLALGNQ